MSSKTTLKTCHTDDSVIEAGIDEAGRGCFWGPIMAGALIWPKEDDWTNAHRELMPNVCDSKKIAPKKRELICEKIKSLANSWGVGSVTAKEIDEQGITWANQEAFRRALLQLSVNPERIIIDGTIGLPGFEGEQHNIVEGDNTYLHVAGASILAKVAHDKMVIEFCDKNPECQEHYSMLSGHGYGTAKHREGLKKYGAHELHRKTFIYNWVEGGVKPVKVVDKGYMPKKKISTSAAEEKCLIKL
jgi:ribonuclease HII